MNDTHHLIFTTPTLRAFQRVGNSGPGAHDAIQGIRNDDAGVCDMMANGRDRYDCRLLEAESQHMF